MMVGFSHRCTVAEGSNRVLIGQLHSAKIVDAREGAPWGATFHMVKFDATT